MAKEYDRLIWEWATERADPKGSARSIDRFCEWVKKTPAQLLDMQKVARTKTEDEDHRAVVLQVRSYIKSLKGRKSYKVTEYSKIKSWFEFHNRKLPTDDDRRFIGNLKSDREGASNKLNISVLRDVMAAVRNNPRKKSVILTQFQTFSGAKELMLINEYCGHYIGEQIKRGKVPIELEMKWSRKQNEKSWYTYIGKAAAEALREYFNGERGYPKPGEPIWYTERDVPGKRAAEYEKRPMSIKAYRIMWERLLASLGYRPPVPHDAKHRKDKRMQIWQRYGLGAHEIRTLAISQSQAAVGRTLRPNGKAFADKSADYFAGHTIDTLGYRQLHDINPAYRKEQYVIVEPYIDPFGEIPGSEVRTTIDKQREEIATLKKELEQFAAVDEKRGRERQERVEKIEQELLAMKRTLLELQGLLEKNPAGNSIR